MRRHLRNATALATSLTLAIPAGPVFAQSVERDAEFLAALEACRAAGLSGALEVGDCLAERVPGAAPLTPEEIVSEDALLATTGDVETVVEEIVPEEPAIEETAIGEPVTEDPVVEDVVTEEVVVDEAPTEEVAVEEAVGVEAATPEVPEAEIVEVPADDGAAVEAPAEPEVAVEAPAEPEVIAAPEETVEAPLVEDAPADAATLVEPDATPEPVGEDLATDADALREALEAEAAAEASADGGQEVVPDAPIAADEAGAPEQLEVGEPSEPVQVIATESEVVDESALAAEVAAQPEPELNEDERRAASQAEAALSALQAATGIAEEGGTVGDVVAAAAAAATATDAPAAEAQVTEEVVAAEDVRRSDQDFATSAIVSDQQQVRDSGLSNREKFALGALGLLAVGTVLNNRGRVVSNSGDRVVVATRDGDLQVLKDDDALLRTEGDRVRTESFDDGSTRTIVTREDGSQVITIRDASLRVLRRVVVRPDGTEFTLIDDTRPAEPVDVADLPPVQPVLSSRTDTGNDALRAALSQELGTNRSFTLAQVRQIPQVRSLAPAFEVDAITFPSASAAINPDQAPALADLGRRMLAEIQADPSAVFLVEGHTDAVGDAAYNLALSDRRAESLALALNEYFGVPVENMVVQGYGERFLKVPTQTAEQANRRAVVREVTDLLQVAAAN